MSAAITSPPPSKFIKNHQHISRHKAPGMPVALQDEERGLSLMDVYMIH
jgi:hypothetical protein